MNSPLTSPSPGAVGAQRGESEQEPSATRGGGTGAWVRAAAVAPDVVARALERALVAHQHLQIE